MELHTLDWERVAGQTRLAQPRLRDEIDRATDMLIRSIEGYVLAGAKRTVTVSVEVPTSWWQHFKRDVLARWVEGPSTPLGRWLEARLEVSTRWVRNAEEVNRNICPHGILEADPHRHLEFLVREPSDYTL